MTFDEFTKYTTVNDKKAYEIANEEYSHLTDITPLEFCKLWAYHNNHQTLGELRMLISIEKSSWIDPSPNSVYHPDYREKKYKEISISLKESIDKNWDPEKNKWKGRKQYADGVDKNAL